MTESFTPFQENRISQLTGGLRAVAELNAYHEEVEGQPFSYTELKDKVETRVAVDSAFLLMCKGALLGIYRELKSEGLQAQAQDAIGVVITNLPKR